MHVDMSCTCNESEVMLTCLDESPIQALACKANTNAAAWLWHLKRKRSLPKGALPAQGQSGHLP